MASKTLYRVFRPQEFESVSGQEQVTEILKKQVEAGQPAHAYLFCGTRGTGKTTTARILANAVNCLHPHNGSPCGECEVCTACSENRFPDIIEIDAASNNGVDNIRDIREQAALLPMQGKYKVYIIDEVHMLSPGAFNALLKTLEEPPEQTIFILATTELRKIPKTILSRCQHFSFHRITDEDIEKRLAYVCGQIGVEADPEALHLIAAQSDGALRDALSLLEQCTAGRSRLTAKDAAAALGISDAQLISELTDHILKGDTTQMAASLETLLGSGVSPVHALQDLVLHLTHRLAGAARAGDDPRVILRAAQIFIEAQNTMRFSPVPQAVLLTAAVRACEPATDPDLAHLEVRLRRLEDKIAKLGNGVPTVSAPAPVPAASVPPAPRQTGSAGALQQFKKLLMQETPAAGPGAAAVTGVDITGTAAVLHASPDDAPLVKFLADETQIKNTLTALGQVYGAGITRIQLDFSVPADEESAGRIIGKLNEVFKNRVTVKDD